MTTKPVILILTYHATDYLRGEITRIAEILGSATPFEITSFDAFRQRFSAYDWDSPGFRLAVLSRYRKICVYGKATKEDREMLDKLRPIYQKIAPIHA